MAKVLVRIKANENYSGDIEISADKPINNVSSLLTTETTTNNGVNGKSWATGYLSLADGFLGGVDTNLQSEVDKYNGFMFGATNSDGEYELELTLEATNLEKILVIGDKNADQYPIEAIIDGTTTIYSDDINWGINFGEEASVHTIKFTKWKRANYNACFTTLKVFLEYIELNKSQLDSIDSLTQSVSNASEIQYGCLPNICSFKILDIDGEIKDYVQDGIIESKNTNLELFVNGTQIQHHISNESSYNNSQKSLMLSASDVMKDWDNKTYMGRVVRNSSLYFSIFSILSNLGYSESEIRAICLSSGSDVYNKLISTQMNTVIYESSYRDALDQILQVMQLNLIEDDNGNLKLIKAEPKYHSPPDIPSDTVIKIPKAIQYSNLEYDLLSKQKYDNVKFNKYNIQYGISQALNTSYSLLDDDGNYSLSQFGSNAQILTIGQWNYLCFFIEVTTPEDEIFKYYNGYNELEGIYPFEYKLSKSNESKVGRIVGIVEDETSTIESYDFVNRSGACHWLKKYETMTSNTFALRLNLEDETDWQELKVVIMGQKWSVTKTETLYNSNSKIYEFPDNTFMQQDTLNNEICESIVKFYSDGILSANITIACTDLYDTNGNKVKNWSDGEILQIGDLVRIDNKDGTSELTYKDGSQYVFKVVGRRFTYNGVPMLNLELQEVRDI